MPGRGWCWCAVMPGDAWALGSSLVPGGAAAACRGGAGGWCRWGAGCGWCPVVPGGVRRVVPGTVVYSGTLSAKTGHKCRLVPADIPGSGVPGWRRF